MKHLSDEAIRKLHERLVSRGAELRDRLSRVSADLARLNTPLPRNYDDAAIVVENDEVLHAIEDGARLEMARIDEALHRLNSGTFAICESCGGEIDERRLDVVPFASHCRHCAPDA